MGLKKSILVSFWNRQRLEDIVHLASRAHGHLQEVVVTAHDLREDHVGALHPHIRVRLLYSQAGRPYLSPLDDVVIDLVLALLVFAEFDLDVRRLLHVVGSSQFLVWQKLRPVDIDDGWFVLAIVQWVEDNGDLVESAGCFDVEIDLPVVLVLHYQVWVEAIEVLQVVMIFLARDSGQDLISDEGILHIGPFGLEQLV